MFGASASSARKIGNNAARMSEAKSGKTIALMREVLKRQGINFLHCRKTRLICRLDHAAARVKLTARQCPSRGLKRSDAPRKVARSDRPQPRNVGRKRFDCEIDLRTVSPVAATTRPSKTVMSKGI